MMLPLLLCRHADAVLTLAAAATVMPFMFIFAGYAAIHAAFFDYAAVTLLLMPLILFSPYA